MKQNDIDTLTEETLEKTGAGFITAVIDDYYYLDRSLNKRKFEDGQIYYPSVTAIALNTAESIDGVSIVYSDKPGTPRFTYHLDMSYYLSQTVNTDVAPADNHVDSVDEYDSYEDLPFWMSTDALLSAYGKKKDLLDSNLTNIITKNELEAEWDRLVETIITTVFMFINGTAILPMVYKSNPGMRYIYTIMTALVITRFVGRSIRLCHSYFLKLKLSGNGKNKEK